MVVEKAMRARLLRLVGGEFRADDIRKLILYLRENAPQHRVVNEIGHFLAHGKRQRGITLDNMREVFATVLFTVEYLNRPINQSDLPWHTFEALRAARKLSSATDIKRDVGMKAKAVNSTLDALCGAFAYNAQGRLYRTRPLTGDEERLWAFLVRRMIIRPAFTQDDLFKDFIAATRTAGLLMPDEKPAPKPLGEWLALVAAEAMHGANMLWPSRVLEPLEITTNGNLAVTASVKTPGPPPVTIAIEIFSTGLKAEDWCEPPLERFNEIGVAIELSPAGKLVAMDDGQAGRPALAP